MEGQSSNHQRDPGAGAVGRPRSFRGLIVPTLTPLTEAEDLDREAFARHLDFMIEAGVDGLFVLGTNGEGPMLRSATRLAVARAAVEVAAGRVPVVAGAIDVSTTRVVDELDMLSGIGLAGYVVTVPLYFNDFRDSDLQSHFQAIADNADAPVLLYNIPQYTRIAMSERLIRSLAETPGVAGLKDSSGNWEQFQKLLFRRPGVDFSLLQGAHSLSLVSLFAGADGLVPGYANLYPSLFVRLAAAAAERLWGDAVALQSELEDLLSLRGTANVHATKVIAMALGLMQDHVSRPLRRLETETAAALAAQSVRGWDRDAEELAERAGSAEPSAPVG